MDVIRPTDALIVVDVQNDFLPGGRLAVEGGDQIVPLINLMIPLFDNVVYTRDWHPADHVSFADEPEYRDGSWPAHCVQGTAGAEFPPNLKISRDALVVDKGDDPAVEAYSGFQATSLDLAAWLREREVERLFITGLATDYCVLNTALGGVAAGFEVALVEDSVRGVAPETTREAMEELRRAGVRVTTAAAISTAVAVSVATGEEPEPPATSEE